MPLLGMGGETEKGIALPDPAVVECGCHLMTYLRRVILQAPMVVCLTIWYAMPANRKKWPCYRKSGVSV